MPGRAGLDVAALARWMHRQLGGGPDGVGPVEIADVDSAGVGQSSDTALFRARWHEHGRPRHGEFVLRRQPGADGIFRHPDAGREFRVLRALAPTPVPVPRVRWFEPDPAVLGAPFFVMDRVHGVVPSGKPSIHAVGWLPTLRPEQVRTAWESGLDALARLHAVDWRAAHGFLAPPDGPPGLAAHLAATEEWYAWTTAGRAYPLTDAAMDYLRAGAGSVAAGEPVVAWGDARPGNIMFDPGTCAAVALLDWEVATIAPAEVDVAHWLVFDEFATTASGVPPLPGYPGRAETIARYQRVSGRELVALDYFEILQCFFLATTLIRQADAHVRAGRLAPGTRMGHDNALTQMLARRLGLPVPELSEDYLRHRAAPAAAGPAPTSASAPP